MRQSWTDERLDDFRGEVNRRFDKVDEELRSLRSELGGLNGLRLYHQRVAVQGSTELISALQAKAATLH